MTSDRVAELIAAKQESSPRVKEWIAEKGPKGPGIAESFSRGVSGASALILQSATVPRRMMTAAAEMFGLDQSTVRELDTLARIASPGNEIAGAAGQRLQYATEYGYDRGEQTFPAKVAEAAGSAVPFAAAGLAGGAVAAGPGAAVASSALGAGMGSAGMLQEAERAGVTGGRKLAAGAAGAAIGGIEGVMGVESALGKLGASLSGTAQKVIGREVLKAVAVSGAGESIEEAIQGGLEEAVRDVVLQDPEAEKGLMGWLRASGQAWVDEGLPAFVVGGIMGGLATAAIQRQETDPKRTEDVPVLAGWPIPAEVSQGDAQVSPGDETAPPQDATAQEPAVSTQPEVAPVVETQAGEAVVPPQSIEDRIASVRAEIESNLSVDPATESEKKALSERRAALRLELSKLLHQQKDPSIKWGEAVGGEIAPSEPVSVADTLPATTSTRFEELKAAVAERDLDAKYPVVGEKSDGRVIRSGPIPNTDSISASLTDYHELPGIRDVPMSLFKLTGRHYSDYGQKKIDNLAEEIRESGEITPLIVVIDKEGPYILEGATRVEALYKLKAKSFPAMVVVDDESMAEAQPAVAERAQMGSREISPSPSPTSPTESRGAETGSVPRAVSNLAAFRQAEVDAESDVAESPQKQPDRIEPRELASRLEAKFPGATVQLVEVGKNPYHARLWHLDSVVVPKNQRGTGVGTQLMQSIVDAADEAGATVSLTPSTDFGATSVGRLRSFYSRFGFRRNLGRRADLSVSAAMIREPNVSDIRESPRTRAAPTTPNVAPTPAPATGTYTQDFQPFTRKPGAFRRTKTDTRKAISDNIARLQAQARAARDGEKARSADSVYAIIDDVSRRFGLGEPGVGGNKSLKNRAAGFYRVKPEEIRLRLASDVRVYLHEVGHHLHKVLFPRYRKAANALPNAKDFPAHWRSELALLGQDLYGSTPPKGGYEGEGWAEFVHFIFADPAHVKKRAPTLYRDVVETLVREQPDTWLVIQEARIRFEALQKEAETNPIRQHVQREQKRAPWRSTADWLRARIINRNQRILTLTRDLGTNLSADLDPYTYAQRMTGHTGDDIRRATEIGTFDVNDPAKRTTGPSLNQILEPVKDQIELWEEYMIAQRVLEKRAQGVDPRPDITSAELRAFIKAAPAEIVTAAEQFQAFNEWLVNDYAVGMGLLSAADAKKITDRNQHYITFRQVRANDASIGGGGRSGKITDKGSGFKRFRAGMGEQLQPPLTAFMEHMRSVMVLARENQLGQLLTSTEMMNRAGMGRWITKVDRPMEATRIGADALANEVKKQLGIVEGRPLPDGIDESMVDALGMLEDATFFSQGARIDKKNREFTVRRDGKPQWYAAQDQQLFDLLEGLYSPAAAQSWAELVRIVSLPGRLLRATATEKNPAFFFGNFAADITQALTLTDELVAQAPARIRGMRQAFLGGDMVELFRASGADMSGLFGEYYDPKNGKIDMTALFGEPKAFGLIKGSNGRAIAKDLLTLGAISRLNNKFELATRLGEFSAVYEASIERGASQREAIAKAGQASADITLDFQRGGTWAKEINKVIPFFNAAIQGTDRLARAIKENPARSLGRVAAFVILPSMIAMLTNWDDEDYWALPMRDRDRYLFFPNGYDDNGRRVWWKVKKPYGLGIFGIAFERSMARAFGINPSSGIREGDPEALEGAAMAILNELRPTLNFAGVQPAIELASGDRGWSMWRENYIVPATDVGLPTDMQGIGRSSSTARFLGSMLDVAPAKVDYAIGAYLGGLGRMATSTLIDPPLRMLTGEQAGKPMEFEDWLVTLRFSARAPRADHEAIARFFEQYEELQRIDRGLKALEQTNREAAEKYFDEHKEALSAWLPYSRTQREMSKHFKALRGIYRDTKMDPDESARLIEDHYQSVISLARSATTGVRTEPAPPQQLGNLKP